MVQSKEGSNKESKEGSKQDLKELSKDGKRKDQWKDRRTGGERRIRGRIDAQGVKGIWHDIGYLRAQPAI